MTAQGVIRGQPRVEPAADVVTRFAPSPTGRLHLGHAVSAIRAHDLARATGGRFLLRIEDIDVTRCRPDHVQAILADLRWLGLEWDDYAVQSERMALYADALDRLRAAGLVYPCFCTRADIAALSAPHGPDGAIYPGICKGKVGDPARPHAWRLDVAQALVRVPADRLQWHDAGAGWVRADPRSSGDVVVARKDAGTSYHLAVTVDDAAQGVTDVVRGVDLFHATHVHCLLQALLDLPTPRYHHHPLLTGPDGARLAKRNGSPTLESMRLAGADGHALAARLRGNMDHAGGIGFEALNA